MTCMLFILLLLFFFFFNDTATTEIYTLSLHDALPIWMAMIIAERTENSRRRRVGMVDVALMGVIAGIPAVLIILQPDLGTMLVLAATVFGVLAIAGVPRRWLVSLFTVGVAVAVLAVSL